jgi:hypothetical protein
VQMEVDPSGGEGGGGRHLGRGFIGVGGLSCGVGGLRNRTGAKAGKG